MQISENLELLDIGNSVQLSGIVLSGKGKDFVLLIPNEVTYSEFVVESPSIEEWKEIIRQSDIVEVEILSKAVDGKLTKALVRKTARMIEQSITWNVFRRDGYKCRYCGNDKVPLTIDHLVLWEKGGPSIEENLVSACRKCNKTRANTEYAEWLKSEYYLNVSKKLDMKVKYQNEDLVDTLQNIPLRVHRQSR